MRPVIYGIVGIVFLCLISSASAERWPVPAELRRAYWYEQGQAAADRIMAKAMAASQARSERDWFRSAIERNYGQEGAPVRPQPAQPAPPQQAQHVQQEAIAKPQQQTNYRVVRRWQSQVPIRTYHQPLRTSQSFSSGWYNTGCVGPT